MIDNVILHIYADLLTAPMREGLLKALANPSRYGMSYVGPTVEIFVPTHLLKTGVPQLAPTYFVAGGFLTPIGKQLAEILKGDEDNDDYRLS